MHFGVDRGTYYCARFKRRASGRWSHIYRTEEHARHAFAAYRAWARSHYVPVVGALVKVDRDRETVLDHF